MRSAHSAFTPYGKRPLAPDNHPIPDAVDPPAKRRRITLTIQASGTNTPNPFSQIARDKILQRLAHSPCHLDLSDMFAHELIMLPAEALGHACAQVSSLILPARLWKLPAFCRQMPALRELCLPDFFGDTLDLKDLPQLQRVEGSGGVRLDWVHADARTELDIRVPQRFRKVRVQRYIDGQPGRTHALPGHAYSHIAPGADAPDPTQLNGIVRFPDNGQPIFCRHIARHVEEAWPAIKQAAMTSAPGVAGIATPTDVATKIGSAIQGRFARDLLYSKSYTFIDDAGFRDFANEQLDWLMQSAKRHCVSESWASYYLGSTNHVMNLLLCAKATTPPVYAATLVDPNALLARRRIEANSLTAIQDPARGWSLSALIEPQQLLEYANPTPSPLLYIFHAQHRTDLERPAVMTRMSNTQMLNGELYFSMMCLGLHEPLGITLEKLLDAYQQSAIKGAQVFHALAARDMENDSGLSAALAYGNVECVRHFTAAVERLSATRTAAHLLNVGPDKLPDQWCESLLTTTQSWSDIVLAQKPPMSASLATLVAAAQRLFESGVLSAEACLRFLQRREAGTSPTLNAIDAAIATCDDALLSAFRKLLVALHTSGAVSQAQCEALVSDGPLLSTWLPGSPVADSGVSDDFDPVSFADFLFGPDQQ